MFLTCIYHKEEGIDKFDGKWKVAFGKVSKDALFLFFELIEFPSH
jgi:hypothetical protein